MMIDRGMRESEDVKVQAGLGAPSLNTESICSFHFVS
jgi:hypothetical protein